MRLSIIYFAVMVSTAISNEAFADVPAPVYNNQGLQKDRKVTVQNQSQLGQQQQQEPIGPPPIIVPRSKLPADVVPPGALARQVGAAISEYTTQSTLNPGQITEIKGSIQEAQRVQSYPYTTSYVPRPVNRRLDISVDLLDEPIMINTALGMLTTFVFLDVEGSPWPISDVAFDEDVFKSPDKEANSTKSSNIFRLQPKQAYAYANITFTLQGRENSPITFVVNTGHGQTVDQRVDSRVEGKNPASKIRPTALAGNSSHDQYLDAFLYGPAPKGARPLFIGNDSKKTAWAFNDAIYLRTTNDLITPAHLAIGGASTGMRVYKIPNVRRIYWSVGGKPQFDTLLDMPESK
ncbi:DotH/IcmK family type IV secretion protein [Iodobacter sp. CM08]|uniref:DotH/IcmK family type IV secretion protein n=1 Tax=Iodobacter sp. CM08 TaxID=3085902 RepID=UPI00298130EA|nr:DotH/IcmK family type IV secretion protein [Iodobacter sp. CM08]MDW5418629.1 DotH/IcmK family type IV secretion protein [Iodobacter sp. CM08]